MRDAYVGFYWTLPVNSHGFRDLPRDVDAAARTSRTIRYQRERVHQHVQEHAGELVAEVAFMDSRTDRATSAVLTAIEHAASVGRNATVLLVEFSEADRWRRISGLFEFASERQLQLCPLEPRPITIDRVLFDPIGHFEAWRERDESAMAGFRLAAHSGLRTALQAEPKSAGRWRRIADRLNREGIKSPWARDWTPEGVRKLAQRAHSDIT